MNLSEYKKANIKTLSIGAELYEIIKTFYSTAKFDAITFVSTEIYNNTELDFYKVGISIDNSYIKENELDTILKVFSRYNSAIIRENFEYDIDVYKTELQTIISIYLV